MDKILNKIKKLIPLRLFKALQPIYHFTLSWLAAFLYRWPSEKLIVVGVTGTTGKTTSVYLIAKTLEEAGYKTGFTSTAMFNDGEKEWLNDKKMTMGGRFFTQRMLARMVKNKCRYGVVETTSEGIRQFRHRFVNYDILVFTGLYPEHIESHGGFENYKAAKGKLFTRLKKCKIKYVDEKKFVHRGASGLKKTDLNKVKKTIIANLDDEHANYFFSFWSEAKIAYRATRIAQRVSPVSNIDKIVEYGKIKVSEEGTSFEIAPLIKEDGRIFINLQLLGAFNAANAMNAVCVGLSQGLPMEKIKKGLESIEGVAGRMEKIDASASFDNAQDRTLSTGEQPFTVIVDYAFEPNAVAKLYETIKIIPHKRIIHVLGSTGGGRDVGRRPILGKLAGENADVVIVTNEDPYDDDPQIIIDQVAVGAEHVGKKLDENLFKILDRREAIIQALFLAEQNDIVLITGKGSEQFICMANGEKIPWDDRGVVRGILSAH
ncbi:UDP-N-acetylmuramyl-tripeptide synthetase [Candidatus Falkowbacteria bacterium]|nr:UDP-N-acetylmuramyl-tripeptide synthetase [Candidatus Falkowbacteria bacterium]